MPSEAGPPPTIPRGRLPWPIRRLICDLADQGHGQSAIARWLGTTRCRVRLVLQRNGKLRGASLVLMRGKPG